MADAVGSRSGGYRRPSDIWLFTLNAASSEKDVLAAVRDYLATWTPLEISRIPEDCRPGKIACAEDVGDFAFRLSQAHLSFNGPITDRLLLDRLMSFFVHANARVAQLRLEAHMLEEKLFPTPPH
jgi:hypothetical protein